MATREELIQKVINCIKKRPDITNKKIYSNVKGSNVDIVTQARKMVGNKIAPSEVKTPVKGKTLEQFKKQFDVREKIKDGLKRLGSDCYMTDTEFREFCGVHINNWRRFADEDQFKNYRVRINSIWHWASAGMVKRMKDIVGIYE